MSHAKRSSKLPPHMEERRTREFIKADKAEHTSTPEYHSVYKSLGVDNSFNFEEFKKNFRIEITSLTDEELVVEVTGVDAPLANAFRRVIIAEVPTIAIEEVYFENNTSIIQDEVLAHRLGLIPINADPRTFLSRDLVNAPKDSDTLQFNLNVKCERKPGSLDTDPEHVKYINSRVYSRDLQWQPAGSQVPEKKIGPVNDNILIAKLRPGQEIKASLFAIKGVGKDHAKFSPVSTAYYRLLPEILIVEGKMEGEDAKKLVELCPMDVFDIEDLGKRVKAKVVNPRNCTMCRECIRHPGWDEKVKLRRVKNHYIFSIESTGILRPEEILREALRVFLEKLEGLSKDLGKQ